MQRIRTLLTVIISALTLSACAGLAPSDGPPAPSDERRSEPLPKDAVPRVEARSKYGNPKSYVVFGKRYYVRNSSKGYVEQGIASWYGKKFHGRRTSSGETYDMYAMSAAHKSLPLPTYLLVTNLENRREAVVRVNDRGPFYDNRIIDLSYSAARKLGIISKGTGLVEIRALQPGEQPISPQTQLASGKSPGGINKVKIYLQAGAFSLRDNALRLKARLASITRKPVRIHQVVADAGEVFRVRLGPLQTVEEADQLVRKMVELAMDLPHIIIE